MKKLIVLFSGLFMLNISMVRADEGMWLLSLLGKNYEQMKAEGFKLTPEDIYNVNQNCLKDAIVGLGNDGRPFRHFCTGEIISSEGLMTTNHHCGYGMLQSHSTVEHDYLRDGFWAYSKDQELPNEGITASILVRMEDVTDRIVKELNSDMSEADRNKKIAEIGKEIAINATKDTYYNAYVADMFNRNQFFLFVYVIYKDVRLVGAPPSSMGKFGGDTDNWMWPRHTCDFSMFRIYTAPDGKPASYSKDNVPLKPKHFLPISIKDKQEGDFAMIMGFPGSTDRYITSFGLKETMNVTNKLIYELRTVKINVLRKEMASSQKINIQYASKYASCSNYWKYAKTQNEALNALNTMAIKKDIERQYTRWATRKGGDYTKVLSSLEQEFKNRKPYLETLYYLGEGLWAGAEMPGFAYQCSGLKDVLASGDENKTNALIAKIKDAGNSFFKDYNASTDEKLMAAMFEYVYKNMDKTYAPEFFSLVEKKYKGNFQKFAADVYAKSIFATQEKFNAFLEKPNLKTLNKDLALLISTQIQQKRMEVSLQYSSAAPNINRNNRLFTEGILAINNGKAIAPDANSTIRLTYGNVKKYDPRDGVTYNYYTTLEGVMQKEDPNNSEFYVPQRLKDLYASKDYGQYANPKGELVTCFISNNDITGGNSGSPVIDANGCLIGLAFDGNSEAMSGDIDFEENLQRCINLDVRYMLFVIDKYAGASNLIKEMDIRQ